ncbi:hypothetical protein MUK70_18545 [Dyadobacter chenwenxiniae]|uniref:Uncharacterized protein n=1 Tax=Dyadobacter chenwenxiniae TaxID=2906456 RepID=A0A9X1TKH0_9BACT|nr:hypothetical protein [Dyadobacter chenwenxiniae]MCF0061243.1 hypothetical protein [Dyadobacter chenwenxiniae]UON81065.1 hypothetical protein MUK70_18545 [Dyadobacter chenwenxiniae]
MKEQAQFRDGKSMWRWLLFALLLTGIVSQNFAEPKSVYRIEEVISSLRTGRTSNIDTFSHSVPRADKPFAQSNNFRLQCERFRFLSRSIQIHTELAISSAPDLLPILMRATGRHLESRSQSREEPSHFLS